MKCAQCGAELIEKDLPCPQCGHKEPEQDEMDQMIQDILEEDEASPTFEEAGKEEDMSDAETISKVFGHEKPSEDTRVVGAKTTEAGGTRKTSFGKGKNEKTNKPASLGKSEGKKSFGDKVITGLRYSLAAVMVLFVLSLFFNWFTLKGNAVNYGVARTEAVQPFLSPEAAKFSIEQISAVSTGDPLPIISFSGMDLFNFGRKASEPYKTVKSVSGVDATSVVAVVHSYYMQAVIVMVVISLICVAVVLLFPSLKGIDIVRNLSVVNLIIMGLNYMSLRFTWFSMFAVKAKDVIKQGNTALSVTTEPSGIAANDVFYRYMFFSERGFHFALVMMVLWLVLGIILTEVKHRKDEIAIEEA